MLLAGPSHAVFRPDVGHASNDRRPSVKRCGAAQGTRSTRRVLTKHQLRQCQRPIGHPLVPIRERLPTSGPVPPGGGIPVGPPNPRAESHHHSEQSPAPGAESIWPARVSSREGQLERFGSKPAGRGRSDLSHSLRRATREEVPGEDHPHGRPTQPPVVRTRPSTPVGVYHRTQRISAPTPINQGRMPAPPRPWADEQSNHSAVAGWTRVDVFNRGKNRAELALNLMRS
jgi:hypothetical protein